MMRGNSSGGAEPIGRAFVSYTPADEEWAVWIAWQLERDGWKVDIQAWDVAPGGNVVAWMHQRLATTDHVVLVVSQQALAAEWVDVEWQSAIRPGERRVVPVRVEPADVDGLLRQIVKVDLFDLDEDEARRILRRQLRAARLGVQPRPTSSPAFPGGPATRGGLAFPPRLEPRSGERRSVDANLRQPAFPGLDGPAALLDRVADATARRHRNAVIRPVMTGAPLLYLDVDADVDGERRQWAVGVVAGQPLDTAMLETFQSEIHQEYEGLDPYAESDLVCSVTPIETRLVRMGGRSGVRVQSLAQYEGRWDPSDYLVRQAAYLEADAVYPRDLYVAQAYVELDGPGSGWATSTASSAGGDGLVRGEDLCASLIDWLDDVSTARFLLVLGDFGHGKTFLLRELARRLPTDLPRSVPMLIELKDLEKSQGLDDLLALHLHKSGEDGVSVRAVRRMLDRGQIVLLFDGFDELAMRVTFDKAAEHLTMIAAAVTGRAKVVLTSRTQHFASDDQWRTALGERVRRVAGSRTVRVADFDEPRIREFLTRLVTRQLATARASAPELVTAAAVTAEARRRSDVRFDLIRDVRDLLGLSRNPRMLSFIAALDERELQQARDSDGTISSAELYRRIIGQWLGFEARRRWPSPERDRERGLRQLREAVATLARRLWLDGDDSTDLDGLTQTVQRAVTDLSASRMDSKQATFAVGSGSLLVRNDQDRFEFVHRSVLEYLVAAQAAQSAQDGTVDNALLGDRLMSDLMVDFLVSAADTESLAHLVRVGLTADSVAGPRLRENLFRLAHRLGLPGVGLDLSGQDLRGEDLSARDLSWANLAGANLAGIRCHDLDLTGADLTGADVRGSRLERVRLASARLAGSRWTGTVLLGARFTDDVSAPAGGSATPHTAGGSAPPAISAVRGRSASRQPAIDAPELAEAVIVGRDPALPTLMGVKEGAPVSDIAYAPDGRFLVARWGLALIIHDSATLRPIRLIAHDYNQLGALLVGDDGHDVAVVRNDGTGTIWSVPDGTPRALLNFRAVGEAPLSPPRLYNAIHRVDDLPGRGASWPHTLRSSAGSTSRRILAHGGAHRSGSGALYLGEMVLDEETGIPRSRRWHELPGHEGAVTALALSVDERLLASMDEGHVRRSLGRLQHRSGSVMVTDVPSGRRLWSVRKPPLDQQRGVLCFSPDGRSLVGAGTRMTVWDAATGEEKANFGAPAARTVTALAFSPDGRRLAACELSGDLGRYRLWHVATLSRERTLFSQASGGAGVSFDGTSFQTGTSSQTFVFDPLRPSSVIAVHDAPSPSDSTPSPSGRKEQALLRWDLDTWAVRQIGRPGSAITALTADHSGRRVAKVERSDSLRFREILIGGLNGDDAVAIPMEDSGGGRYPDCLAFDPEGLILACGAGPADRDSAAVRLFETSFGGEIGVLRADKVAIARSVAFSADGAALAAGMDGHLGLSGVLQWDVPTRTLRRRIGGHSGAVLCVAWHPFVPLLASGDEGIGSGVGRVRVWNGGSGALVAELAEHPGGVTALGFSPNGRLLVSGGADGCVQIWDVSGLSQGGGDAARLATIALFDDNASAALLPDGSYKLDGDPAGELWWSVGLARFEPGEIDLHDRMVRRLDEDDPIPGLAAPEE